MQNRRAGRGLSYEFHLRHKTKQMSNRKKILTVWLAFSLMILRSEAQSYEVQCLVLDCSKLAQLKSILSDMKKGYQLLAQGYGTVKDISEGNFHLHEVFLDNLMKASPVVRNYSRIADIISDQLKVVKEYKAAWQRFKTDAHLHPEEIDYIGSVYSNLLKESLNDLSDLTVVITDGTLRMSDDERLHRIDEVAGAMHDKLVFLRQFNSKASLLSGQRFRLQNDVITSPKLYGIN